MVKELLKVENYERFNANEIKEIGMKIARELELDGIVSTRIGKGKMFEFPYKGIVFSDGFGVSLLFDIGRGNVLVSPSEICCKRGIVLTDTHLKGLLLATLIKVKRNSIGVVTEVYIPTELREKYEEWSEKLIEISELPEVLSDKLICPCWWEIPVLRSKGGVLFYKSFVVKTKDGKLINPFKLMEEVNDAVGG